MAKFFTKKSIIIMITIIILLILAYLILPVSIPLVTALITAMFLEPAVKLLQNRLSNNRKLAVLIVFIIFLLIISISSFFIITKVLTEGVKLVEDAPRYMNQISEIWKEYEQKVNVAAEDFPKEVVDNFNNGVQSFISDFKESVGGYLNITKITAFFTDIPNYLVSIIVFLIALFLFMLDMPKMKQAIFSHLTDKTAEKVNFMTSRLTYVVFGFLKAQIFVSIIIFIISLIGLLFIAPEVAIVMSVIIWVIDFIPFIGSIIIFGPWALYHLITGNIAIASQLAILAIVQLIVRRTVEPKVMGTQIGLSPLATLIAMYIGLKLLGFVGLFIGPLLLIVINSAKEAGIIKFTFKI